MQKENGLDIYEKMFDKEAKAKAFDQIAKLFYNTNFSSASKSEIDLLMFSIYMDAMIDHHNLDGVLDYNETSDYKIGTLLGITQQRVRSLKVKKQARYPVSYDWRKSLNSIKDKIHYDEDKKRVIIPVRDPNLYLEIQNFIEDHDGYIEIQRGGNFLQMKPEHYISLMYEDLDEKSKEKVDKILDEYRRKSHPDKLLRQQNKFIHNLKKIATNFEDYSNIVSLIEDALPKPLPLMLNCVSAVFSIIKK